MSYRIGYCPQCNAQIMVKGADGRWSARKPNFAQTYLVYENGIRIKTTICKDCLPKIDYQKISDSLHGKNSQAFTKKNLDIVYNKMCDKSLPISHLTKSHRDSEVG